MRDIETVKEYIEKGHKILSEKYWKKYDEIVPIRVGDLYHGMELGAFLEIIELYDKNHELQECARAFDRQNHSGMSASLVASLIYNFHDNGDKIVRALGFECKDKNQEDGGGK
jgi:hypothetical protein